MKISVSAPEPVPLKGDFLCTAPDLSSPLWGILLCRTSDRDTLLCKINAGWKCAAAFLEKRPMIPQRPSKDQGNCSHDLIACTSLISAVMEWTCTSPTGEGTKLIIPILSSTVSACTEICLWGEFMSQVKNWGLLVALEVYRFWILAALSCKLQAIFLHFPSECSNMQWSSLFFGCWDCFTGILGFQFSCSSQMWWDPWSIKAK